MFLTGIQALVRLPMAQIRRDRANGLNTAAFISGYRGSPLGGYDQQLMAARKHLEEHGIKFQPGVNEDLAATAIWGSQQLNLSPGAKYDGVVGIWYGKGPGVDRSGDVFRHGNTAGSAKNGGVLCLAGDDHGAKSSTVPHQSDHAFISALMPYLYPSSIHEMIEMGLLGIAMSRYSGCWVGMKVITETVETTAEIDLTDEMKPFIIPTDFEMPPGGLNLRWPDDRYRAGSPPAGLQGLCRDRFCARQQDQPRHHGFAERALRHHGVGQELRGHPPGAARTRHHAGGRRQDRACGSTRSACRGRWSRRACVSSRSGSRKSSSSRSGARSSRTRSSRSCSTGATTCARASSARWTSTTSASCRSRRSSASRRLRVSLTERLLRLNLNPEIAAMLRAKADWFNGREAPQMQAVAPVTRTPYFCSGCPHNTSTKVPEGSRALAGIGCHFMALWMDRNTETFTHMGGEGVPWVGIAPFTNEKHVFANLGDGTYFHSGSLAIRQAVASESQHHLQDPLQRRDRDDRRPACRRRTLAAADHPPASLRGHPRHLSGLGKSRRLSGVRDRARRQDRASRRARRGAEDAAARSRAARRSCSCRPARPKSAAAASAA